MRKLTILLVVVALTSVTWGQSDSEANVLVDSDNTAIGGGNANAGAQAQGGAGGTGGTGGSAGAAVNFAPHSTSIVKTREQKVYPPGTSHPFHMYVNHGGWDLLKGYFVGGPSGDLTVYERQYTPSNKKDMDELYGVLEGMEHDRLIDLPFDILNTAWRLCGWAYTAGQATPARLPHRFRGIEVENGFLKDKRPKDLPLMVFVDGSLNLSKLKAAGYVDVGTTTARADNTSRTWDQVEASIVAETLPWNIEIIIISGGMKGISVATNDSIPVAIGAGSNDVGFTLQGATAKGATEGVAKAMIRARGYRKDPVRMKRISIPSKYDAFRNGGASLDQTKATYDHGNGQGNGKKSLIEAAAVPNPQ